MRCSRLALRRFAEEDLEELLALFRDPAVRRYLLDDSSVSAQWVRDEITASDARFEASGAGLWSVRLRDQKEIIGFAGFREFFDPPQLQLLYGLLPRHWGYGLATEAAAAICEYAFEDLDFPTVAAAIDVPNVASARVLERLGMRLDRTTAQGVSGTAFYVLQRETWATRQASRRAR